MIVVSVVVGFLYMSILSFFILASNYQVEKVYGAVFFKCRVKFYVVVYLVYVHVDVLWGNFCFVEYD